VAGHRHRGGLALGARDEREGSLHRTDLRRHHQRAPRLLGPPRQLEPVEAGLLRRERHVALEVEADHPRQVTTRGRGQLDSFHHRDPAIEAHAEPPAAEPARAQLPRQRRRGILRRVDDDVGQPVAAGEGHDREPVVPQEDPDPWRPHASGSGRQERMVASRGAFGRPRCTMATTRLRTTPATRPSASMRNTLLPTASPRPAKRRGTLG